MKKAKDRYKTNVNTFNNTALGRALTKGLDGNAYTFLITCINPLKADANMTVTETGKDSH